MSAIRIFNKKFVYSLLFIPYELFNNEFVYFFLFIPYGEFCSEDTNKQENQWSVQLSVVTAALIHKM